MLPSAERVPEETEVLDFVVSIVIIICPARSLEKLRVPSAWKTPLNEGRLLILACFPPPHHRATAELAARRNQFVAALADEVWFAHIAPGGQTEQLAKTIASWPPTSRP